MLVSPSSVDFFKKKKYKEEENVMFFGLVVPLITYGLPRVVGQPRQAGETRALPKDHTTS